MHFYAEVIFSNRACANEVLIDLMLDKSKLTY